MLTSPIGIFGGTFDPIHLGHIHLVKVIYETCHLQKILLVPCYQSPFKNTPTTAAHDRLNMIKLAIKSLPFLEIDDYEVKRPVISYTIQTLEYLRQKNSSTPLAFIIGTDAFNRFDEWQRWQEILEFTHLIVVNHPKVTTISNKNALALVANRQTLQPEELQKKIAGLIYVADIKPLPVSATEIRNLIKERQDTSNLVTPEVWQYINKHKLYTK